MKNILLVFLSTVTYLTCSAQFASKQIITTALEHPGNIYAGDIDGDEDLDVIMTSFANLYWIEKIDEQGNFGLMHLIDGSQDVRKVYPTDIDGDGDMDILYIKPNELGWLENTDGNGTFSLRQIIEGEMNDFWPLFTSDLDGDGYLDVVTAIGDAFTWFKNIDGLGNFQAMQNLSSYGTNKNAVPGDVDGDGDIDIITSSYHWCECDNPTIGWFENLDGLGNFGEIHVISTDFQIHNATKDIIAFDGDNDGDIDIFTVAVSYANGTTETLAWSENIDSQGNFEAAQIIISEPDGITDVIKSIDIDNDGILELLVDMNNGTTRNFMWFGNDEQGGFELQGGMEEFPGGGGVDDFQVVDFDNDGDYDIIAAKSIPSANNDEIFWHKNTSTLSINNPTKLDYSIFPNPTTGLLNVESETKIYQITITNQLGQVVLFVRNRNLIDISNLPEGLYFIKIKNKNNHFEIKKIIKK